METEFVENVDSYTHNLPIHAFKSAVHAILNQ